MVAMSAVTESAATSSKLTAVHKLEIVKSDADEDELWGRQNVDHPSTKVSEWFPLA